MSRKQKKTAKKNKDFHFTITGELLKEMLSKVSYAMGKNDYRPWFNGIHIEMLPDRLRFTATNGLQFAEVEKMFTDDDNAPAESKEAFLAGVDARRFIKHLNRKKNLTQTAHFEYVDHAGNKLCMACKDLTGATIETTLDEEISFPDDNKKRIKQMRKTKQKPGVANRKNLLHEVEDHALYHGAHDTATVLQWMSNKLTIKASGVTKITSEQEYNFCDPRVIDGSKGPPLTLYVKTNQLIKALKAMTAEQVAFHDIDEYILFMAEVNAEDGACKQAHITFQVKKDVWESEAKTIKKRCEKAIGAWGRKGLNGKTRTAADNIAMALYHSLLVTDKYRLLSYSNSDEIKDIKPDISLALKSVENAEKILNIQNEEHAQ